MTDPGHDELAVSETGNIAEDAKDTEDAEGLDVRLFA